MSSLEEVEAAEARMNAELSLSHGEPVKITTYILFILLGLTLSVQGVAQNEATSSPLTKQEKAQALAQEQQREDAQKSQKKAQKSAEKSQKKAQKNAEKSQKKAKKHWNQQHPSVH